MEHLAGEYYTDRDPRHWENVLYYWKDANVGEKRPEPVEIKRFHMSSSWEDVLQETQNHASNLAREMEERKLKEGREGLTRYVAYLTPMQVAVLKAMEAKFEEESE